MTQRRWQDFGERRILVPPMWQGLVPESTQLVRGSFRRIMTMRFRPANISVIIVDTAQPPPFGRTRYLTDKNGVLSM